MNATRRKEISAAYSALADVRDTVETLKDEESEYLENMPESLKGGDKGSAAEDAISALESAISSIDDALSSLSETQ